MKGRLIQMNERPAVPKKRKGHPNSDLKDELLKRGYYVQPVGRGGSEDIEYLIVTTEPPKLHEAMPSSSN